MPPEPQHWWTWRSNGSANEFHQHAPGGHSTEGHSPDGQSPDRDTGHQIWVRTIPRPALVLGSTQPESLIRDRPTKQYGIEVCKRRSGGGLVWVDPRHDCWVDVIIPPSSPWWDDDVGRSFHWLGDLWAEVLVASLTGPVPTPVVSKQTRRTEAGRVWCFADLGHGEVSIAGRKVVGLSQRRTRNWTRIQCLVQTIWPGTELLEYVDLAAVGSSPTGSGRPDGRSAPGRPDADPRPDLDPGLIKAGLPPGVVAPGPDRLAESFVQRLTAGHQTVNRQRSHAAEIRTRQR